MSGVILPLTELCKWGKATHRRPTLVSWPFGGLLMEIPWWDPSGTEPTHPNKTLSMTYPWFIFSLLYSCLQSLMALLGIILQIPTSPSRGLLWERSHAQTTIELYVCHIGSCWVQLHCEVSFHGTYMEKQWEGPNGSCCENHSPGHDVHSPTPSRAFISVFFFKFDFKYLQHHTSSPPDITNELLLSAKPTRWVMANLKRASMFYSENRSWKQKMLAHFKAFHHYYCWSSSREAALWQLAKSNRSEDFTRHQ